MLTSKYISHLFYVHRELPIACATALMCLAHVLVFIAVNDPFVEAVMAFGAIVMAVITISSIYSIYRFEKKWGAK
jgi:hypothetical protein